MKATAPLTCGDESERFVFIRNLPILVLLPLSSFAGPLSGGGGGMEGPASCSISAGDISLGVHRSAISVGLGSRNQLEIKKSAFVIELEGRGRLSILRSTIVEERDARIIGRAKLNGCESEFEVTISKMFCGSRERILVELPFWLTEYAYDPQKFGNCESSLHHPDHVGSGASGHWFE